MDLSTRRRRESALEHHVGDAVACACARDLHDSVAGVPVASANSSPVRARRSSAHRAAAYIAIVLFLLTRLVGCAARFPVSPPGELVDAGYTDLRPADANVLQFLDWDDRSRIQDLAARAQMTWQSMAELVAHLEQGGYVARRSDPRDRRARIVYLTERGRALTPVAIAARQGSRERMAGDRRRGGA